MCDFCFLNHKFIKLNSPFPAKVEFVIGYTGRGELMYATVNVLLADVDPNQLLLQTHSVQFQVTCESH